MTSRIPFACVLGSMDLIRPLGVAGVHCIAVAPPGAETRFSRFTKGVIEWVDPWTAPELLADRLLAFAEAQVEPPTLFYEEDRDLLLVSRLRNRLAAELRFVIARSDLVEDLVDKARFQRLAADLDLPVPPGRTASPRLESAGDLALPFPIILKPLTREGFERWAPLARRGKALRADDRGELDRVWDSLADSGVDVIAQQAILGPETRIESYHAYVDEAGEVVAEFTGRKIRTRPAEYGFSTALELTDDEALARVGRELVDRLRLTGVAKLDFKRSLDGRLYLLEINPRFTLWHHLAAVAGTNIPALVHADLTGSRRPAIRRPRAGARWCYHLHDALAAREDGISIGRWLRWAVRCDAVSTIARDDPLPFLRGFVWPQLLKRLPGGSET